MFILLLARKMGSRICKKRIKSNAEDGTRLRGLWTRLVNHIWYPDPEGLTKGRVLVFV